MRASKEELGLVRAAMDTEKKARVFKRYQALYLFLSGKKCIEVAEIVGITKNAVSIIHIKYKTEGLKGIPAIRKTFKTEWRTKSRIKRSNYQ